MDDIELQALAGEDPSLRAGSVPYVRAVLSQQNQEVLKHFDETFNWMPTTGRSRVVRKLDVSGKGPRRVSSKVKPTGSCSEYRCAIDAAHEPTRTPKVLYRNFTGTET